MMARVQGIDVSKWQGTMNWTTAYNAGNRFTFAKATQGTTIVDDQFVANRTGAKNAGLLIGFYHFATPDNITDANGDGRYDDAVAEADWFVANAGAFMGPGYLRPVLDLESNPGGLTNAQLSKFANDFCWRVQQLTGQDPLIYCNTNWATNVYNSTVNIYDLWIANWNMSSYGHPVTGTGNPPIGVWSAGGASNWDFWQYSADGNGQGAANGARSSAIDLNVFNGSDINLLKQNFVVGAPDIPTGPSPANGAANVSPLNFTFNWNDSPGAVAYDLYIDNMTTPAATNLTQSQYFAGPIAGGAHTWRVVAKGVLGDDDTHVSGPVWSFTASSLPLPGVPSDPTPHGVIATSKPLVLDWADTPNASTYDVYLGSNVNPTYVNLTASQTPQINPLDGVRLWRVVAKNATGSTSGPQWSYTMDSVAPSASFSAQPPMQGSASYEFTVTYSDATSGVDFTTIDSSDAYVTGPGGYSQSATLVDVDFSSNGSPRVATYRVDAPGNAWDAADYGVYTVHLNANQVKDAGGLAVTAGAVGTFDVDFANPNPFAYAIGPVLHLDFAQTELPLALSHEAGWIGVTAGLETLVFAGINSILAHGTSEADLLTVYGTLPATIGFTHDGESSGGGDDLLELAGGEHTFASDLGAGAEGLMLQVNAGVVATLGASQRLRALSVAGDVVMAAGGDKIIVTKHLDIAAGGKLDLADNDLVIDYDDASPIGSSDGAVYSGIAGLIQAARNGGGWNGSKGIFTSESAALTGLTTLGVGESSALLGLGAGETAVFAGATVDDTAVLLKYTYTGDANLDGFISGDDYGAIDFTAGVAGASGYANGDFNYDGLISGDDYSAIDFNLTAQGAAV